MRDWLPTRTLEFVATEGAERVREPLASGTQTDNVSLTIALTIQSNAHHANTRGPRARAK
jgi:hypothetical protein